jgi:hypothetical protein
MIQDQAARKRKAGAKAIEDRKPADQSETRIIRTKRKTYVLPGDAEGIPLSERYPGARLPDRFKDLKIYQTPDGPVIARSEETGKNQPRRARDSREATRETGRKAQQKRQADKKAGEQLRASFNRQADGRTDAERKTAQERAARTAATAQKRVADASRKAEQRRDRLRKEQVRRDFNRTAEDKKAAEQKQTAAKQEAQKRADERKAAAWVAQRQKAQAADSLAEERRQTDRLRNQHREENRSLKSNESAALDRHWHAIKRIDGAEQRALDEFDVKRAGLTGRAAELVKGKDHFDRQRAEIGKRHEADRMKQHRDLEALKERQFKIAQETRLRQVQERKAIFDRHRDERRVFARKLEAELPRQIEARKQAFNKAAELEQTHKRDRAQERGHGLN